MGDIANHLIDRMISGKIPCGTVYNNRPDTKGIDANTLTWIKAKVIGYCAREIGSIILVADSPDERYYFVRGKRRIGTINKNKVQILPDIVKD